MYEMLSFSKDIKQCALSLSSKEGRTSIHQKTWLHYPVLHRVLNYIKTLGFEVGKDLRIEQHFKCLTKDHWYGRKGNLEFKAERYPAGFRIEFFQNVVFENQCGGEYDFDKYGKMPYLIRLSMVVTLNHVEEFLNSLGIATTGKKSTDDFKLAEDKVKFHYVDSCHHEQKDMNFNLCDVKHNEPDYNCHDRDKKRIENGQVKYFRDYSGRLNRGVVFHNLNSMWWVITNKYDYTNISSYRLFDPTVEDFSIRRLARNSRRGETLAKDRNKGKTKFYYIWSKKHFDNGNLVFWGPGFSGYTVDLNNAGIFTLDEVAKSSYNFEIITKENVHQVKSSSKYLNDSFLIACDDVELLGRKILKIAC